MKGEMHWWVVTWGRDSTVLVFDCKQKSKTRASLLVHVWFETISLVPRHKNSIQKKKKKGFEGKEQAN